MTDRYYGIQFKCKTAQTGDQIRYIGYGLIKSGELTDDDIVKAKTDLVNMIDKSKHPTQILDFNKSQEYTKEEWDQLINTNNGTPE